MKRYLSPICILMLVLFASSCASTKYISIDILQPARVSFPDNVVNVAIVDNAGLAIPDSIVDETHTEEEILTSMSKDVFLKHLQEGMNEQKYFNDVMLYPYAIRTDKNYGQQLPLLKDDVQQVAKYMDADAIVSLDVFSCENSSRRENYYGILYRSNMTSANILFRVYDSNGDARGPAMATGDSITWLTEDYYDGQSVYIGLANSLAEGVIKQLVPYWETQERWYFTNSTKEMKNAHKEVEKGNWTGAADLWGQAFDKQKQDKERAKIAVNIALANENLDDINNAVEWIRVAKELIDASGSRGDEYTYIYWYRLKLLERRQGRSELQKQLGIEEVSGEEVKE